MSNIFLKLFPKSDRKNFPSKSIGVKLFIAVLSGALVGLAFTSFLFYQALAKQAKAALIASLDVKAQNLEGSFNTFEKSTKIVGDAVITMYDSGERREQIYVNLMGRALKNLPLATGLGFGQPPENPLIIPDRKYAYPYAVKDINNNSKIIAKGGNTDPKTYTENYFIAPIKAGKDIWLEPISYVETTFNTPKNIVTTSYALPLYDNQKNLLCVLNQDVQLDFLSNVLADKVTENDGYFVLVSAKGNLLAYHPNPQLALELKPFNTINNYDQLWKEIQHNLKSQLANNRNSGILSWQDSTGKRQFWAYRKITNNNWILLASAPESVVLGPVLLITVGGTFGAAIMLGGVVALFVRKLNQRLQPIMDECNLLAETNPQTEELMNREDELGRLTISFFNLMGQLTVKEKRLIKEMQRSSEAFQALQKAQAQVIQNEKMSGLGQLVAGVAHEINNPINFIYGNLPHASHYTQDIVKLLTLYQQKYPNTDPEIADIIEEIDLDFIVEDLQKMLSSMSNGADRIREIVLSLRNFSRLDESEMKYVNIHDGVESTLLILQHRLKARAGQVGIQVIKEYGNLPLVECYAGQLNQVFMNVLSNAIDAIEKKWETGFFQDSPFIKISTRFLGENANIVICIQDNGCGIPQEYQNKLFDPFFTTKPVGKGTGLGLSISYQIVVEKHKGILKTTSESGEGAEFWIEIPISQTKILT